MSTTEKHSAAATTTTTEEDGWYYVDTNNNNKQVGPHTFTDMYQMLAEKVINAQTIVWKDGFQQWVPLASLDIFVDTGLVTKITADSNKKDTTPAATTPQALSPDAVWLYIDNYRSQQGPVNKKFLKNLYLTAQLSEANFVWKSDFTEWKRAGEVKELEDIFVITPEDQEAISFAESVAATAAAEAAKHQSNNSKKAAQPSSEASTSKDNNTPSSDSHTEAKASDSKNTNDNDEKKDKRKRKKKKDNQPHFKNVEHHSNIYVTGLPNNISVDEVHEHFKKVGIIKEDEDGQPKIKLYKDDKGQLKGDALITYLKEESVTLAQQILDGSYIRPTHAIKVEKAVFQQRKDKVIAPKVKKPKTEQPKTKQSNKLSWDEDEDSKGLRIVVLKHMFHPDEAKNDPNYYTDLKKEVTAEIQEKAGQIEKVTIFEGNVEGVLAIKFKYAAAAVRCIDLMKGRYFGGRQIQSEFFDGKTDYRVRETNEDMEKRLKEFGDWLESE